MSALDGGPVLALLDAPAPCSRCTESASRGLQVAEGEAIICADCARETAPHLVPFIGLEACDCGRGYLLYQCRVCDRDE